MTRETRAAYQAFWLLRIGFTVAPILFGIDKFFNWTVHWPDYLAGWLGGIVINLLTNDPPRYYDIALRDFGLFLAALTLTRLAWAFARSKSEPVAERAPGLRRAA